MIVLDEQLLGYNLAATIRAWYRGKVTDLPSLRPGTLIPDDAIPELLRASRQPTFVTINVADFWRRLAPDKHFCVLCFALPDRRVDELPGLLRRVFTTNPFRTRRSRLGKIARIGRHHLQYYTISSWAVQTIEWKEINGQGPSKKS